MRRWGKVQNDVIRVYKGGEDQGNAEKMVMFSGTNDDLYS
jgi:hypothetical protein